jgi:hypothetical protein
VVLSKFDETQRDTRTKQLAWWAKQFAGLTVAEVTADRIAKARDACAAETCEVIVAYRSHPGTQPTGEGRGA